jgi:hypothetical protein
MDWMIEMKTETKKFWWLSGTCACGLSLISRIENPEIKPCHQIFDKGSKIYTGETRASSINCGGKIGYLYAEDRN